MDTHTLRLVNLFILRHRLLIFLISILALMLILPFVHENFKGYLTVMEFFFSVLLIAGIYIVSANRKLLTVAILLGLLTFTIIWFNIILQSRDLLIFSIILEIIFFTLTTGAILSHILTYKRVTADKIYGAICGYLLIGIIWALIYTALENFNPGSFAFTHGLSSIYHSPISYPFYFAHFLYFSLVTLTTLGYGDITPLNSAARMLSSLEAVIGQLYIAVLIARLVGLHISHNILKMYQER